MLQYIDYMTLDNVQLYMQYYHPLSSVLIIWLSEIDINSIIFIIHKILLMIKKIYRTKIQVLCISLVLLYGRGQVARPLENKQMRDLHCLDDIDTLHEHM